MKGAISTIIYKIFASPEKGCVNQHNKFITLG